MLTRVTSGLLLAGGIVAVLVLTPWWGMGLVVAVALLLCATEYQRMARPDAPGIERVIFVVSCAAITAYPVIAKWWPNYTHGMAFLIGFNILAITRLARPDPVESSLQRLGLDLAGLVYLGATFPIVLVLRGEGSEGGFLLLMVMVVAFSSDTGGYFAGRFLGRHKLYPKISPKKTIEGAIGGIAMAIGGMFVARAYFPGLDGLSPLDCVLMGTLGASFTIIGDLVESMMKRAFGVKDSGTIIPGHGGMLDRIDGLLFCGPALWLYLEVVK
jgi:phosphatidate cytidylyltransferase